MIKDMTLILGRNCAVVVLVADLTLVADHQAFAFSHHYRAYGFCVIGHLSYTWCINRFQEKAFRLLALFVPAKRFLLACLASVYSFLVLASVRVSYKYIDAESSLQNL